MAGTMTVRRLALLLVVAVTAFGCSTAKQVLGVPSAGDVPSEPEYVWVEEDKTPVTLGTVVFGKSSIIAPPEIVARYGSPPGGGKISSRQGMPTQTAPTTPVPAQTSAAGPRGGAPTAATPP